MASRLIHRIRPTRPTFAELAWFPRTRPGLHLVGRPGWTQVDDGTAAVRALPGQTVAARRQADPVMPESGLVPSDRHPGVPHSVESAVEDHFGESDLAVVEGAGRTG